MEGGELNGLIDREMAGGRAGRRAGAGKTTREAQGKLRRQREEDREKGKSPGKPRCGIGAQEDPPPSFSCFFPACMLQF